ncbi:MAG TPA: GAF domain-containing protein, partial [Methylobacterium sp.]
MRSRSAIVLRAGSEEPSSPPPAHGPIPSRSALIERERRVLGRIAAGTPLDQVLEELLRAVEAQSLDRMLTSVLFLSDDGRHMLHGAAPSLPQPYNAAIDGIAIGEGVGSCGTAAARGTPVYASDIAADPLWKDFRELALEHGLRACWSTPIKAANGEVLGTFAIYYAEPREPTAEDIEAISVITQTTALAIERHLSDRALRRSQEELRHLNQTLAQQVELRTQERDRAWRLSQDLLAVVRKNGTFEAVNAAWTRLLGWEEHELVGTSFTEFTHPDDVTATQDVFASIFDGPLTLPYEYRFRHRDNSYRWFAWTAAFEDDRVYANGRHVTAEREQAEALRQAQKMEAVGQLTGGVAHDFNNFLTVMRSSTDLLKRPDLPEERRQRYITAISETVDRAAKLTAQLLAFARRQTLQPTVFDVGAGVGALTEMLATLTGSRIEIATDLPDTPCFVSADPSQFDTAIVNMAINARDAMQGEGRLTLSAHPVSTIPAVRAHPHISGDFVAVCIEDTGTGIAPERLDRIFEPFFTTKDVGQGTGLGLSQVFGFAKQSGGEVRVQSEVGAGTMFVLYLPRVGAPADAPTTEPEPLVDGHGTSVLLIEDNAEVGAFATQTLSELGYGTVLVGNAVAALSELARNAQRFDVVFTDVVMPGMNGIDLAKE